MMTSNHKGFTLIETLIYIGLMTIVMGGGIISAFYLIDTSDKNRAALNSEVEAEFLLRKIDWALTGASSISVPSAGKLEVTKESISYEFDLSGTRARINGGTNFLTGERAEVTALHFDYIASIVTPSGTRPAAIHASSTVDGKEFGMRKYLRK